MSVDVTMPQMGESIFEGTIIKWLKQPGDTVAKDEPLFEISTDKVDAEIPSPVAGVLAAIKIPEGATVEINTVVAVIDEFASASHPVQGAAEPQVVDVTMPQMGESIFEGTIIKWLKKPGDAVAKDEPLFEISTDKVDAEIPAPTTGILAEILITEGATVEINTVVARIGAQSGIPSAAAPAKAAPPVAAPANAPHTSAPKHTAMQPSASRGRIRSSPLARRIAKEHGLDLSQVAGTGSEGRVTKDDVLRAIHQAENFTSSAQTEPLAGELVPFTRMRAIIAQRMLDTKRISPHVHTIYKADMTRVAHVRDRHKVAFEKNLRIKLTFMPFIATAVIGALRRFPIVNASLENIPSGPAIRYHQNINLGIAVALDWGLIVPVVRKAEQLSFAELAQAIIDLALRARTKKLNPDEVGGSTFTLTNSGVFGDEFSTPLINQPEAAILGLSALKKEPVVVTDSEGDDTISIRSMQHLCLGFDHRLIDGADACRFMLDIKTTLENWNQEIA